MYAASDHPPETFDLVVEGDFRTFSSHLRRFLDELPNLRRDYDRIGFVERFVYNGDAQQNDEICPELRREIDGDQCRVLVYGDVANTRKRLVLDGVFADSVYLPTVRSFAK